MTASDDRKTYPDLKPFNGEKVKYPGIPTTADGAGNIVWVETHISQGAGAYPITSSTTMGSGYQVAVAKGIPNLWGEQLVFIEPESEHSSASVCEGFALSGGRVTNFTSGQGLVLMKEVLYTISGKRLPAVFHIGARALTSHSLNVHAGHDDVMAVADCGWGMLFGRNAQEAGDLALIARRAAEDSYTPFFNIIDGFLTTHTIQNVLLNEKNLMKEFVGDPYEKLVNLMDPHHPVMSGVVQNQDSYMKGKIAQRTYYDEVLPVLERTIEEFYNLTGRSYGLIETYRMEDAEYAIVGMGSMTETAETAVDLMRERDGIKAGVVHVTCFRPFPSNHLVTSLKNVKALSVVEKMDNPLAESNPLTMEVKAVFSDALSQGEISAIPRVFSGSAGLGGRDLRPDDFTAAIKNMSDGGENRKYFCLGIDHELALKRDGDTDVRPEGSFSMRGHSVGGYGSVTTNKIIATIIEDLFKLQVQAYPKYGSEKKGLPTTYFLTISPEKVRTHCELNHVDFVPMNDVNAFNLGNPLMGLSPGGIIFIQTSKTDPEDICSNIPRWAREFILKNNIQIYALNTVGIAKEVSSRPDLEQRMQGIVLLGIFLKVTPFREHSGISDEELMKGVERSIRKYFGKRGEEVVQDNLLAVRRGYEEVFEIPREFIGTAAPEAAV